MYNNIKLNQKEGKGKLKNMTGSSFVITHIYAQQTQKRITGRGARREFSEGFCVTLYRSDRRSFVVLFLSNFETVFLPTQLTYSMVGLLFC